MIAMNTKDCKLKLTLPHSLTACFQLRAQKKLSKICTTVFAECEESSSYPQRYLSKKKFQSILRDTFQNRNVRNVNNVLLSQTFVNTMRHF